MIELLLLRRRKGYTGYITKDNLPKFIRLGSCMRLVTYKTKPLEYWEYWRDGGSWGIGFYIKDGKLYSKHYMDYLNNKELVPVTEEEWRRCNGLYAPNNI